MINIRPARILEAGLADRIPSRIIACFRLTKALQIIPDHNMLIFTQHLLGLPPGGLGSGSVLDYLDDQDVENVVAVYLQTLGWLIVSVTRRRDTPRYEFVLVHGPTRERAIVHVTSGSTPLIAADYKSAVKTFLFAASGDYGNVIPDNVNVISPSVLRAFMRDNKGLLPGAVVRWMQIADAADAPGELDKRCP